MYTKCLPTDVNDIVGLFKCIHSVDIVCILLILRKADIYKCDECDVFIRSCIEKMETMDSQQVAFTFLWFLQR